MVCLFPQGLKAPYLRKKKVNQIFLDIKGILISGKFLWENLTIYALKNTLYNKICFIFYLPSTTAGLIFTLLPLCPMLPRERRKKKNHSKKEIR